MTRQTSIVVARQKKSMDGRQVEIDKVKSARPPIA